MFTNETVSLCTGVFSLLQLAHLGNITQEEAAIAVWTDVGYVNNFLRGEVPKEAFRGYVQVTFYKTGIGNPTNTL